VRNARNVAIVMVLALAVAFAPAGGNVVDAIFTALTMGFLAGIAWMLYTLSRQNQLTLATLSDRRRAIFFGGFGMIALLIAGTDKMLSSGTGTLLWILLLVASVGAIWRVWVEANTY
jgi:Sec-independent protein secretion pathway component TatC